MRALSSDTERVFLAPGDYVDSDHPVIRASARNLTRGATSPAEKAKAVFYAVRDLHYHADDFSVLESYRASSVLMAGHGYCVAKASLFAALSRAAEIPARPAFADVRNHLASPDLLELMGTDVFAWHGYVEVLLDGRWIKVSPTFDAPMCKQLGVKPLEFDGVSDALLQDFDGSGRSMTYVKVHGAFADVPARFLASEMPRLYPKVSKLIAAGGFKLDPGRERASAEARSKWFNPVSGN
jgi:transglutaminase-like putative cysteine protease